MTVRELYDLFDARFPVSLREGWDNDGLMLCPDPDKEVKRVLIALDATRQVADYAVQNGFDLILTHHPMIFHPLTALTPEHHVARKAMLLLQNGISVFSFHTRLDAAEGGVNDTLASLLGLSAVSPFGEGESQMGRIGTLPTPMPLDKFAEFVKRTLHSDCCLYAGNRMASRVAILGGDGKDFVPYAREAGADTYLSGRIGYNLLTDAAAEQMNLVEAGHYFTEAPVCEALREILFSFLPEVTAEILPSNEIRMAK